MVSAEFQSVLSSAKRLNLLERQEFLRQLGVSVAIEAWSDSDFVPEGSAARPSRPSRQVPICWENREAASADVTGCPWCRRPLTVRGRAVKEEIDEEEDVPMGQETASTHLHTLGTALPSSSPKATSSVFAYTTLLYGPSCHRYFLGALVLGHGLKRYGGDSATRLLMHTPDVPKAYLEALRITGWNCKEVDYVRDVASGLFHNWRKSRFIDVFTKLRALELTDFEKVLLLDLDLLIRSEAKGGSSNKCSELHSRLGNHHSLESLFDLRTPAAMGRGPPVPNHGEELSYARLWAHPTRREGDQLPPHQQASGINAGVMLLQPDQELFAQIDQEVRDWYHPEHYGTYMPEQEYLGRLLGTFDRWSHISCRFNFEVDKNERIPHDFTEAHEVIRAEGAVGHQGAAVLHYSGTGVKPWDLLWRPAEPEGGCSEGGRALLVGSAEDLPNLLHGLREVGPGARLDYYSDKARLWEAMLEWLAQLSDLASELADRGCDPVRLLSEILEAAEKEAQNNVEK
eukprot:TRINITY_DN8870_c0_g1_i3.p1 TRINITY_DN8870_c0_g1~~TRINITY_DN8870_c0_g1_i3.p1  ORF type:complete len:514 (+),score=99.93 TRINITY_DN8870_c0_g1_i3:299-1840(+)